MKFKIELLLGSTLTLELRIQIVKRSLVPIKNPKWSLLRPMNAPQVPILLRHPLSPSCRMTRQDAAAVAGINDSGGGGVTSSSSYSASGLAARLLSGMTPQVPDIVVTADNFSPAGE